MQFDDPKIIELTDENTCKICNNRNGKYTCPRCNVLYCSLDCYKAETHQQCSENFYRDCVMKEMTSEGSDESKRKMYEILQRMRTSDEQEAIDDSIDSDDEDLLPLNERLSNIDLDDADSIWENLTNDEKQEFEALVQNGDVSKLIPKWQPWWTYHKPKQLVTPLNSDGKEPEDDFHYKTYCPKIKEAVDLQELTTTPPSDCVKYNIYNTLAAYVYTVRYFNGEHFEYLKEAVNILLELSNNLKNNANFSDLDTAIEAVHISALNCPFVQFDVENIKLMRDDCQRLRCGPEVTNKLYYINAALSDIYHMFVALKNLSKKQTKDNKNRMTSRNTNIKTFSNSFYDAVVNIPDMTKDRINLYIRKISYYLSYVKSYGMNDIY